MTTCLVTLPFGPAFDAVYKQIARTVLSAGFEPVRADDIGRPRAFQQLSEDICKASVCVADLTGQSAAVLYTLGMAHALRKPVVLLAQKAEELPFDLRLLRHIVYHPGGSRWEDMLSLQLQAALRETVPLNA